MADDLQPVIDALERARQAPNAYNIPGITVEQSFHAMFTQTMAVNAAVLAWLEYQVSKEQEKQEGEGVRGDRRKPPPGPENVIRKT